MSFYEGSGSYLEWKKRLDIFGCEDASYECKKRSQDTQLKNRIEIYCFLRIIIESDRNINGSIRNRSQ